MRCLLLLSLAFCLPLGSAYAQSLRVSMMAEPNEVRVGEPFQLEVRADSQGGQVDDLILPDLSAFRVVGQSVSRPFQLSFGFGAAARNIQSSTVYRFTLVALRPGKFSLGPARAVAGSKSARSAPLTLIVQGSGAQGGAGTSPQAGNTPGARANDAQPVPPPKLDGRRYDDEAFLRIVADRDRPYLGEQVTATLYLYSRRPLENAPVVTREPSTEGFWVHDLLPPSRSLQAVPQEVRGALFYVYVLRRFALFPLKAGELSIGAAQIEVSTAAGFGWFGPSSRVLRREGSPLTMQVRPLPKGAPSAEVFVGNYRLESEVDSAQVATGDAFTLKVQVQGEGRLRDVQVEAKEQPGLRFLPPKIVDQIESPGDRVGGKRSFEWVVIAERAGSYTLPFSIDTFDPQQGRYRRVSAPPLRVEARGRDLPSAQTPSEDKTKSEGSPKRPALTLRREWTTLETRRVFGLSGLPLAAGALFLLLFPWLLALALTKISKRRIGPGARGKSLRSSVWRREVRQALSAGDLRQAYDHLARALRQALADELGLPPGATTANEIAKHLRQRGLPASEAQALNQLLERYDARRFGAETSRADEVEAHMQEAEDWMNKLHTLRLEGAKA